MSYFGGYCHSPSQQVSVRAGDLRRQRIQTKGVSMNQRASQRRRAGVPLGGWSPEDELLKALRDAPEGLTLSECRKVLRPVVGRSRLETALASVRENPRVDETIERRTNDAGRSERYLILRLGAGRR